MNTLEWRGKARVVAYVDLVLSSIVLLGVILFVVFACAFTDVVNNLEMIIDTIRHSQRQDVVFKIDPAVKNIFAMGTWIVWLIVLGLAIYTFFQMWAAVSLLKATDVGSQDHEALGKAAIWRNVTVALLILDLIKVCGPLFIGFYISGIFWILCIVVWGIFLYIVQKFMSELQSRLTMTSFSDPTVVTMKN